MLELQVPGRGHLRWQYLVMDVNGTIAVDGALLSGVAERTAKLKDMLTLHLLTADTQGTAGDLAEAIGARIIRVTAGEESRQKREHVLQLGPRWVIAIGNGANDAAMLETASLGIAVLGREGSAISAVMSADLIVTDVVDALDLLLRPKRLIGTLRD